MKSKKFIDLNEIGRFSMSDWSVLQNRNKIFRNKSNWDQVKIFGLKNIIKIIKKNFKSSDISRLSLIDIGCNDGYLTEQLAKLKFKEVVGIEPRKDVITRGKTIRKKLGIISRVKYCQKKISELSSLKSYDLSICSGVLHHTDNIFGNLKKILNKTNKMMILEGEFLPEHYFNNEELIQAAQLKDIIYDDLFLKKLKLKKFFGITLKKFETSTYDGSTIKTGLVEIPTINSIEQYCKLLGYEINVVSKKSFKKPFNIYRAVLCIFKSEIDLKKINYNYEFEKNFMGTILPLRILRKFKKINKIFKFSSADLTKYSIVLNRLKYNLGDKLNLEYAKFYYSKSDYLSTKKFLLKIINKNNSDWFSYYRSLYLMFLIDRKNKYEWKKKLFSTNPSFPVKLLKIKL